MKYSGKNGFALIAILLAILIIGLFVGGLYFNRVKSVKKLEHQTRQQIEKQAEDQVKKLENQMKSIQENDPESFR